MKFEVLENVFTISLDPIFTLALATVLLLLGFWIKNVVKVIDKYCIPAPVVGGFLFMFITFIGHQTGSFEFQFENIFQGTFMLAFFTTVGLGASFKLLKTGGKLLIIYWLIAGVISIIQNSIGIVLSKTLSIPAPYALLSSAISMIGGHGAAISYGNTFSDWGYAEGPVVGAAAATFGLISAVLIGGPLGRRLIVKHNLKPNNSEELDTSVENINVGGESLTSLEIIRNIVVIIVTMAIGSQISKFISMLIHMDFPTYVGAMFTAVIVRNANEKFKFYKFDFKLVDEFGNVMLNFYLALAMMTLKLWDLSGLLSGIIIVVLCQAIAMILISYFVVFRILGSDYDAAVMCAGLCGHGLGATPSAIVNMTAVNEKYGMSRKAMMIVPIVGAFLVDIIYHPQTIFFIRTFVDILK